MPHFPLLIETSNHKTFLKISVYSFSSIVADEIINLNFLLKLFFNWSSVSGTSMKPGHLWHRGVGWTPYYGSGGRKSRTRRCAKLNQLLLVQIFRSRWWCRWSIINPKLDRTSLFNENACFKPTWPTKIEIRQAAACWECAKVLNIWRLMNSLFENNDRSSDLVEP